MFQKIIAFFMAVFAWIASLFGGGGAKPSLPYSVNENVRYGTYERNVMDVYIPNDLSGDAGLFVAIHGGSWIAGDKSAYTDFCKTVVTNKKMVAITVNYRYLDDNTTIYEILDDITAAVGKAKEVAAAKGINLKKMMLAGHSAGGHISMMYAYTRQNEAPVTPAAVADFCGPSDLTDEGYLTGDLSAYAVTLMSRLTGESLSAQDITGAVPALKAVSPVYYVNSQTVPTIVCHGQKDTTVPFSNATTLVNALEANGVRHDFVIFPNSGHGLDKDSDCYNTAIGLMSEYADTYVS